MKQGGEEEDIQNIIMEGQNVSDVRDKRSERLISRKELLFLALLKGLSYLLNSTLFLKTIWNSASLVSTVCRTFCSTFALQTDQHELRLRWICVFHSFIISRIPLIRDSAFQQSVSRECVKPLLNEIAGKRAHWHYHLIATSILVLLNSPPLLEHVEAYSLWLLKCCDSTQFHPLLNSLAAFALTITLKHFNFCPEALPLRLLDELHSSETLLKLTKSLTLIHHESLQPTTVKYPETVKHLVEDICRILSPWPLKRSAVSVKQPSFHNMLFWQTYFQCLQRTQSGRVSFLEESLPACLTFLCNHGSVELEAECAFIEMIGGILRASRKWPYTERAMLWNFLHPMILKQLGKGNQDFIDCWRNGIRFIIFRFKKEFLPTLFPLFNLILRPSAPLEMHHIHEFFDEEAFEGVISTFDFTKRLRIFRAFLEEITTEDENLISVASHLIQKTLSHSYKQVREEISRIAASVFEISSRPNASERISKYENILRSFLLNKAEEIAIFVDSNEICFQAGENIPVEFCEAESILIIIQLLFKQDGGHSGFGDFIDCLPLLLACAKHPNINISSRASSCLYAFCAAPIHTSFKRKETEELVVVVRHKNIISSLLTACHQFETHPVWKIRKSIILICEVVGLNLRLLLYRTKEYSAIIEMCIFLLKDLHGEISKSAKFALSSLFVTCNTDECYHFMEKFKRLAGPTTRTGNFSAEKMAGVLGLASLVQAVPYHVPEWLPETITCLAGYGSVKMPDTVRNCVEKSLQEFYRTHQDAWQQEHVKHFTEEQLDILETYKGKPSYFL